MATRVALQGDIIRNVYEDELTAEMVKSNAQELDALIESQKKLGKKALLLLDITSLKHHTADARKAGVEWINSANFDKFAIFGGDLFLKYVANLIIAATGKKGRMQHFGTEAEAVAWLTQ